MSSTATAKTKSNRKPASKKRSKPVVSKAKQAPANLNDYQITHKGIKYEFKNQLFSPEEYLLLKTLELANNSFSGLPPNKPVTLKRLQKALSKQKKTKKTKIEEMIASINKLSPGAVTKKSQDKEVVYQINISTDQLYNSRTITLPVVKDKIVKGKFIFYLETGTAAKSKQDSFRPDGRVDAGDYSGRLYLQRQLDQRASYQLMPRAFAEGLEKAATLKKSKYQGVGYLLQGSDNLLIGFGRQKKKKIDLIGLSLIKVADNRIVGLTPDKIIDINRQLITAKDASNLAKFLRNPDQVLSSGKVSSNN